MRREFLLMALLVFVLKLDLNAQTTPLSIEMYPDTLLCNGHSNGEIAFRISGGQPPYHYEWKQLGNNFVFELGNINVENQLNTIGGDLTANGYVVEITDADGLVLSDTAFVVTPYPIYISETIIEHPTCLNACDASISLLAEGGSGEVSVTWADIEEAVASRSQLCEGAYSFFLIDENGCSQKGIIDIVDPASLTVESTLEEPSCAGLSDGRITLEPEGGTLPYHYYWENGTEDDQLDGLAAGTYQVTIEDSNLCGLETSLILEDGLEIIPNIQINYGCGDGNIIAVAYPINGQEPFQTSWSTGLSGDVLYGISAGDFSLTLTDVNGCVHTSPFSVDYVPSLELSAEINPVTCPEAQDGSVEITLNGGLPPFEFTWSNNTEEQNLESVSGGDFTLNVLGSGCAFSQNFTVSEPIPIQVDFLFQEIDGLFSATAIVSGGTPPYQLSWSNGESGPVANQLQITESYSLSVTDNNLCHALFDFEANITHSSTLFEGSNLKVYPNPVSDFLLIEWENNSDHHKLIQLYDAKGRRVLQQKWNNIESQKINLSHLISGAYLVRVYNKNRFEDFRIIKN